MRLYHGTDRPLDKLEREKLSVPSAACLTKYRENAEFVACQRRKERGETGDALVYVFDESPPAVREIDSGWVLEAKCITPIQGGEVVDCSKFPPEAFE